MPLVFVYRVNTGSHMIVVSDEQSYYLQIRKFPDPKEQELFRLLDLHCRCKKKMFLVTSPLSSKLEWILPFLLLRAAL